MSQTGLNPHTELVNEILVEVSKIKGWRCWKQTSGVFRDLYSERIIKVGVVGWSDIGGTSPSGIIFQCEVKTGNATQTKEQKAWEKMITDRGGYYIVARSVEDAVRFCRGKE